MQRVWAVANKLKNSSQKLVAVLVDFLMATHNVRPWCSCEVTGQNEDVSHEDL
jgi:hypothetical protein